MSTSKNWVGPVNLEIDKVTADTSLSTDTPATTERVVPLNLVINTEKYDDPCQSQRLEPRYVDTVDTENLNSQLGLHLPSRDVGRRCRLNKHEL
jgi:hypothetical protein